MSGEGTNELERAPGEASPARMIADYPLGIRRYISTEYSRSGPR